MPTICYKPPKSCTKCEYYKYDEDYLGMVCAKDVALAKNPYKIAVGESRNLLEITDSAPTYEEAMNKIYSEYSHMKYAAVYEYDKEIFIRRKNV